MKALLLNGSLILPKIDFNSSKGELRITGRSIPEHPVKFYQPIDSWLVEYIATGPSKVHLFIHLDYLNTHSTECILILMKKLETYAKESGNEVAITWGFDKEDEDMEVLGEDLATMLNIPFKIIELAEED